MDIVKSKKRGRPATGRAKDGVVFVRVAKGDVQRVKEGIGVILGRAGSCPRSDVPPVAVPDREQITALLDNIVSLEKERDEWKEKHGRAVSATQDQLASYWKREYLKLRAEVDKRAEFSQ